MNPASGESKKVIKAAESSGVPIRFKGILLLASSHADSGIAECPSESFRVYPGAMQFTVAPVGASCTARLLASASKEALAAAVAGNNPSDVNTWETNELTATILPV
tara:strand:- start:5 stop:322 length:318 start_codon:yes stop_codon:yes gene_type:complete